MRSSRPTTCSGGISSLSRVNPSMSANRTVTWSSPCAIVPSPCFNRWAMAVGNILRSSISESSCSSASSRRACSLRSTKKPSSTNPPSTSPEMLSTMNATTSDRGKPCGWCASRGFRKTSTASTTKNASSHGIARRTPSSATAANGTSTAHRIMPLEATKPPSVICKSAGRISHAASWVVRKISNRLVRDSAYSPTSVTI